MFFPRGARLRQGPHSLLLHSLPSLTLGADWRCSTRAHVPVLELAANAGCRLETGSTLERALLRLLCERRGRRPAALGCSRSRRRGAASRPPGWIPQLFRVAAGSGAFVPSALRLLTSFSLAPRARDIGVRASTRERFHTRATVLARLISDDEARASTLRLRDNALKMIASGHSEDGRLSRARQ